LQEAGYQNASFNVPLSNGEVIVNNEEANNRLRVLRDAARVEGALAHLGIPSFERAALEGKNPLRTGDLSQGLRANFPHNQDVKQAYDKPL